MDEVCDKCIQCAAAGGPSLLMWSALHGHARCLELQLQAGADVNKTSAGGLTPLINAAGSSDEKMKWGDIFMADVMGALSVRFKNMGVKDTNKCLDLLLDAGADVNAVPNDFKTAMMSLAQSGNHEYVQKLIDAGADVNALDHTGSSALIMAASLGHDKCVDVLLRAGADAGITNILGFTALSIAAMAGHQACVKLLKEGPFHATGAGVARVTTATSKGNTMSGTSTPPIPDQTTSETTSKTMDKATNETTNETSGNASKRNTGKCQSCTCSIC